MAGEATDVIGILNRLSQTSTRPRYAFMVLSILAERAGPDGRAGPFIREGDQILPLREWIGYKMAAVSGRDQRRKDLEKRVRAELADKLPPDLIEAQAMVDAAVDERVRASGASNFSRVMSELEKGGFVRRFYQGYRTNHKNRGGRRHVVAEIDADVSAALRRRDVLV